MKGPPQTGSRRNYSHEEISGGAGSMVICEGRPSGVRLCALSSLAEGFDGGGSSGS